MNETTNTQATPVATQEQTQQAQQVAQRQRPADIVITAKVVDVDETTQFGKPRIAIKVDKTFKGFDKNGTEIESKDNFTIDSFNLAKMLKPISARMACANMMSKSGNFDTPVFKFSLWDCTITFTRHFCFAGEARETGNEGDVYSKDSWKTTITKVVEGAPIQGTMLQLWQNVLLHPDRATAPAQNSAFSQFAVG